MKRLVLVVVRLCWCAGAGTGALTLGVVVLMLVVVVAAVVVRVALMLVVRVLVVFSAWFRRLAAQALAVSGWLAGWFGCTTPREHLSLPVMLSLAGSQRS